MNTTDGKGDHELRQTRLSSFGRMLACMTVGYVALIAAISLWLGKLSFNRGSVPMLVATVAFGALWILLRGAPRTVRCLRGVELSTLLVGITAFSTTAMIVDLAICQAPAVPANVQGTSLRFNKERSCCDASSSAWLLPWRLVH